MAYDGRYKSPEALLQDANLSHDEKKHLLQKWRDDERICCALQAKACNPMTALIF